MSKESRRLQFIKREDYSTIPLIPEISSKENQVIENQETKKVTFELSPKSFSKKKLSTIDLKNKPLGLF